MLHTVLVQSPFEPHAAPVGHVGEHAGAAHLPAVHTRETQSAGEPQPAPSPQFGAHAGGAHLPLVHVPEPQSPTAPQLFPSGHAGLHAGAWHFLGVPLQLSDPQSVFAPHPVPSLQVLAQALAPFARHLPLLHPFVPAPQSLLLWQSAPAVQLGRHAGAAQNPLVQTFEPQSAFAPHWLPLPQCGAQPGAWHRLFLQVPDWQSPPVLHAAPSAQFGVQAAHRLVVQTFVTQSPAPVHALPVAQLGEQAGGSHLFAVQTLPPVHALPVVQHGWPAPPHCRQVPFEHTSPAGHAFGPVQHAWPVAPQVTQLPATQACPATHRGAAAQQGWVFAPQAVHVPPAAGHTSALPLHPALAATQLGTVVDVSQHPELVHALPVQQGADVAPHATQLVPLQT